MELLAELFYLALVEFALATEDLGNDALRTKQRCEVFLTKIIRGH